MYFANQELSNERQSLGGEFNHDFTKALQSEDENEEAKQQNTNQFKKLIFRDEKGIGKVERIKEIKLNPICDGSKKRRNDYNSSMMKTQNHCIHNPKDQTGQRSTSRPRRKIEIDEDPEVSQ